MYEILRSLPWFAWVPICAIVCSAVVFTVIFVVNAVHRHEERMAMIKQGLDPSKLDGKE